MISMQKFGLTYEKYAVGDEALIHMGTGTPSKGTVVAVLNLPGYSMEHYVIELPTSIEPVLEVRSGNTMEMTRVKPKITRTYWLCHTSNATDCNLYGWTDKAEAEKWARQVNRTVSITGPHTVEFEEGSGL